MSEHLGQSSPPEAFEISWHDDFGYRVSVPRLLEESERLTVVPLSEYEKLRAEAVKLVAALDHWSAEGGGPEPRGMKINTATGRHATRTALAGLREVLSATTEI